jgi:hypothetical protein
MVLIHTRPCPPRNPVNIIAGWKDQPYILGRMQEPQAPFHSFAMPPASWAEMQRRRIVRRIGVGMIVLGISAPLVIFPPLFLYLYYLLNLCLAVVAAIGIFTRQRFANIDHALKILRRAFAVANIPLVIVLPFVCFIHGGSIFRHPRHAFLRGTATPLVQIRPEQAVGGVSGCVGIARRLDDFDVRRRLVSGTSRM